MQVVVGNLSEEEARAVYELLATQADAIRRVAPSFFLALDVRDELAPPPMQPMGTVE